MFCDIIRQESRTDAGVMQENADIVAMSPYAPRFPFETWMLPKHHQALFEDAPRQSTRAWRGCSRRAARMNTTLRHPPYNLLIHSGAASPSRPATFITGTWRSFRS